MLCQTKFEKDVYWTCCMLPYYFTYHTIYSTKKIFLFIFYVWFTCNPPKNVFFLRCSINYSIDLKYILSLFVIYFVYVTHQKLLFAQKYDFLHMTKTYNYLRFNNIPSRLFFTKKCNGVTKFDNICIYIHFMNNTLNVIKKINSKVVFHSFNSRTLNRCLGPFLTMEVIIRTNLNLQNIKKLK